MADTTTQAGQVQAVPPQVSALPPTHNPDALESEHIEQALNASQTAMDAIGTITDIATYTLTTLGVIIATLALWGAVQLVRQARYAAKQIANARLTTYMASDEFQAKLKDLVSASVLELWQNNEVPGRLAEAEREPNDPSPFPEEEQVKK